VRKTTFDGALRDPEQPCRLAQRNNPATFDGGHEASDIDRGRIATRRRLAVASEVSGGRQELHELREPSRQTRAPIANDREQLRVMLGFGGDARLGFLRRERLVVYARHVGFDLLSVAVWPPIEAQEGRGEYG
jgi:hypothetical protein